MFMFMIFVLCFFWVSFCLQEQDSCETGDQCGLWRACGERAMTGSRTSKSLKVKKNTRICCCCEDLSTSILGSRQP
jgi:hypothetical protein